MKHLTLYGRSGCHLCEEMQAGLARLQAELDFDLNVVDVDLAPGLARRYGALVPVLSMDGEEICHYFLDTHALLARLAAAPPPGDGTA